jgi:hypothetical protein
MPAFDVVQRWIGRVAVDRNGEPLGAIIEVFYDAESDQPGWALLDAAVAGAGRRLVPVMRAVEDGTTVRVPVAAALVEAAPGMEPGSRLWPQEEAALYEHYGLAWSGDQTWDDEESSLAEVEFLTTTPSAGRP